MPTFSFQNSHGLARQCMMWVREICCQHQQSFGKPRIRLVPGKSLRHLPVFSYRVKRGGPCFCRTRPAHTIGSFFFQQTHLLDLCNETYGIPLEVSLDRL